MIGADQSPLPSERMRQPVTPPAGEERSVSAFSVTVGQVYEGPFDLLLDLIRKQNISVYDIPMARITSQFLEYTHRLKQTDVDGAAEFIYTASLLIQIKSKVMLPRDPSLSGEVDGDDPRRELVDRLLEHERFKAAAAMLLERQQREEASWTNPGTRRQPPQASAATARSDDGLIYVDLVQVFQQVLDRLRTRPAITVSQDEVNVEQMTEYLKARMAIEDRPFSFGQLLEDVQSEQTVVAMFLAMLELVRLQALLVYQPSTLGDVLMKKGPSFNRVVSGVTTSLEETSPKPGNPA